ncbi:MAG: tRNA pseudouridine(38-40) synthase TruA [Chloroflexi bacterium RBG_16_68_14]|nr:MAG: tRNA pseudouridine(38-40) synthase TruA [Chloroflexi bacterium RBG_16_68_14]
MLEYDGSPPLAGSQLQKNAPSIQRELETALYKLTGERPRVAFAGRTDAGVHARGQVAAFTTASTLATDVFVRGLNAWLPAEIAVRRALEVAEGFDPRRHAASRTYRYTIYNGPARSPLWRAWAWHVAEPLDAAAMRAAATELVGEHDFAAFSRREGVRTVRCVRRCQVAHRGHLVTVEIEANAFLRQQVRRTVGALVQVGSGRLSLAGFRRLLRPAEAGSAGPLAPAHGLCLLRVSYPDLDLGEGDALL